MALNHRRADNRTLEEAGITPLSLLIAAFDPAELSETKARFKDAGIPELIAENMKASVKKMRVPAFLLALELTERGIAPCFRRSDLAPPEATILTINQEYDLLVSDFIWLSKHKAIDITVTSDPDTWRKLFGLADSLFWLGNRPIWQIVKKLKLTERQQWECRLLKSQPIKQNALGLQQRASRIYSKLENDLPSIMRTGRDEPAARLILQKRKRLWFCAEMCKWAPTETARLYGCMTGETLTRFQVANQLLKIARHKHRRKTKADQHDENTST